MEKKLQKVYQTRDWCAITNSTLRYVEFIKKEKQMPINNNAHNVVHPIDFENNKNFLSIDLGKTHSLTHTHASSCSRRSIKIRGIVFDYTGRYVRCSRDHSARNRNPMQAHLKYLERKVPTFDFFITISASEKFFFVNRN